MQDLQFSTESPIWLVAVCLLVGLGYALLLYTKKASWSRMVNILFAGLRALTVALLCFLLLGPFLRRILNTFELPTLVFAIDDSESMRMANDSAETSALAAQFIDLAAGLRAEGIRTEVVGLSGLELGAESGEIKFDKQSTDLSGLLSSIGTTFADDNLVGVYLMSDGIYNKGFSPTYLQQLTPVSVLAWGDTVPRRDIAVTEVLYNKISYAGNRFPIVARLRNIGYAGRSIKVRLMMGAKVLETRTINFATDGGVEEVEFFHVEEKTGRQHYSVAVEALEGEAILANNIGHAYLEIIENREEILVMAAAPHPDLKAIRAMLADRENFHLTIYIPGLSEWNVKMETDLVIFHQLPKRGVADGNVSRLLQDEKIPKLFFMTSHTDVASFNATNKVAIVTPQGNKVDEVRATMAETFQRFGLSPELPGMLRKAPPISAPYAEVALKPQGNTILWQKVGSVTTDRPMLAVNNAEPRSGLFLGDGLWQWRLAEYEASGSTTNIDALFTSLFKYLSSKDDKRKFRVFPSQDEYAEGEDVHLIAEVYNDIYELEYGQAIDLKLSDRQGNDRNYSFTTSAASREIVIRGLSPGIYDVIGKVKRASGNEMAQTQFSINKTSIEAVNTTADFGVLRDIASNSGGKFYGADEIEAIRKDVLAASFPSIVVSDEEKQPFINVAWVFWLLIGLFTLEWAGRKFKGEY